ncbi:MAG: metallophosphoesterase [Paracoccaceae bacterium]
MKLIILSDIHLTVEGRPIIGINPTERLDMALAHAARMHPDADHYVLLGDLAHLGQNRAYRALAGRMSALGKPYTAMLGNHDNRANFRAAFPDAPDDGAGFVQSTLDTATDRLVFLDTLHPDASPNHSGMLCAARLGWLDAAITGAGGRRVSVFMHHPPLPVGFVGMDAIALANPAAFWAIAQGRIAHLFCGHIHRTISGHTHGTGFTIFKSPAHQMPMDMTSTDSAVSVAEPGAYGIVLLRAGAIIAHSEDFTLNLTIGADPASH